MNVEQKIITAENPNTPPEVLTQLAEDEEFIVRNTVAANPNTPPDVLGKLGLPPMNDYPKLATRYNVAANPNTPKGVLDELGENTDGEDLHVLELVAGNPNAFESTLKRLSKNEFMQRSIAANPSTPVEVLERLTIKGFDEVRLGIAANPSTPTHILTHLASDKKVFVRAAVAENPNTPPEIVTKIKNSNTK